MNYNIIATGSSGNAVIIDEKILVDFGVAYSLVKPFLNDIEYLLLTHRHGDHLSIASIIRMSKEYPKIMILGNSDVIGVLSEYRMPNLFVIDSNEWYELFGYTVASVDTKHNVPNVAYRIIKPIFVDGEYIKDYKVFYSTDTRDLYNVEAKNYDLYFIEFNHCEEMIDEKIAEKIKNNVFAYEMNAKNNHQSNSRAIKWLKKNNKIGAEVVPLHISSKNNTDEKVRESLGKL